MIGGPRMEVDLEVRLIRDRRGPPMCDTLLAGSLPREVETRGLHLFTPLAGRRCAGLKGVAFPR